jgi:hypothetical protein
LTVVRHKPGGPRTADELDAWARDLTEAALSASSLHRKVLSLWRIEGTVFSFFARDDNPTLSLCRSSMPLEAGPPAHCGLAMATVLHVGFHPLRILERLQAAADPRFITFCHETVGLVLAISQRDLVRRLARVSSRLGLFRYRLPVAPAPGDFLASLPDEQRRLAAHGYGRGLYFSTFGLRRAISRIERSPELPITATVRGLVSAHGLINCRDLDVLLAQETDGFPREVVEGLDGGLFNVLCLLEWTVPGCLGSLSRHSNRGARLLEAAESAARSARHEGSGPPLEA